MSTADERKGHKQEAQIRVHCIYATDGRQNGEVLGEKGFFSYNGSDLHVSP
jgi:hypothetical protein